MNAQKLFLSKKQLYWFTGIAAFITIPFVCFCFLGIEGESGLILLPLVVLGTPWTYLYVILFKFLGITSPNAGGPLTLWQLLLFFMAPVYINIYLIVLFVKAARKLIVKVVQEDKTISTLSIPTTRTHFWNFNSARYYVSRRNKIIDVVAGIIINLLFIVAFPTFMLLKIKHGYSIIIGLLLYILILPTILFGLKKRRFIAYGYALGFLLVLICFKLISN